MIRGFVSRDRERDDADLGLVADLNDLRARLRAELADTSIGSLW